MKIMFSFFVIIILVAATAAAFPDEASGTVISVESGDVFDIQINKSDLRTGSGVVTVKLADVSLPPVESTEGKAAKEYAENLLINRTVWLDIDDASDDGRDPLGRLLCVVRLEEPGSGINLARPFNAILVMEGHAEVDDSEDDEFDPMDWWQVRVLINEVEANPQDYDEDNEWVELYNGGEFDADVSSWSLTTAGGSVVSIEAGTIIPPLGYLVVTADGYWLRNSDETVVLRDQEGREVDKTPSLDDEDDEDYSWSRYPDGGDEWVYIEASPGQPVPPIELSLGTLSDLIDDDHWLQWSSGYRPSGPWDVSDFLGS